MSEPRMMSQEKSLNFRNRQGSALLLTLLSVSLLLGVVMVFVVQVRMGLREVTQEQQLRQARAQAKLALQLAIGQLQEAAGADQRVTGVAGLAGHTGSGQQGHWTGVWTPQPGEAPVWLVSGAGAASPGASLNGSNSVLMVPEVAGGAGAVRVPAQPVAQPVPGRIAWWTGDEGVKARVDVTRAGGVAATLRERKVHANSPREPDMLSLEGLWATGAAQALFARGDTQRRHRLVSRETLGLAAENLPPGGLFHDVTVHGYGLPVNVRDGGLKADWSVILDRRMEGTRLVEHYMGARPTNTPTGVDAFRPSNYEADIWAFPESQIYNPDRFFLSERIGRNVSVTSRRPGPNLGVLWHYGRLWREVSNNQTPLVGNHPRVESDMRRENWLPYVSANRGGNSSDQQHTNSAVTPILSHLQLGLRLRATPAGPDADGMNQYRMQVEMKPVIGMWNPYTVGIQGDRYLVEWLPTPLVRLRITPPTGPVRETTTWFRVLEWSGRASDRWMQMNTPSNTDFQPGEVRMFSLRTLEARSSPGAINLSPNWTSEGALLFDLMTGARSNLLAPILVPEGSLVETLEVLLQDTHDPMTQASFDLRPETAMTWLTFKARGGGGIYMTRYTGMWNGGRADRAAQPGDITIPARVLPSSANRVAERVENLVSGDHHMATWAFHLRTTTQMTIANQRIRGWMDADPRAIVGASRWDGTREPSSASLEGWNFLGALMGAIPYDTLPPSVSDGHAHLNRGLVSVGPGAQQAPQMDTTDPNRFRGFMGASNTPVGGYTHLPLFDVPTAPLVSVGQFQHAQLGRYTFEPGFVAGNSYANVRIPLDRTVATNFNGITGFNLHDISYDVNLRIWDQMYFSTLAPDYVGGGMSFDQAFSGRLDRLPNPRMVYVPDDGDPSLDALLASAGPDGRRGAEALSARIRILGAFNINSTSKTAWKAVLSSMVTAELPVVNPRTRALSWESPEGIRFHRFGHVLSSRPYLAGEGDQPGFWQGWRKLTAEELDALAEAIVEEVARRGPFRSMAEFVNRNPDSPRVSERRKGALQAALDRTVNVQGSALPADLGRSAQRPLGAHFSGAFDGESEAAGFPGFLLQGDLLQSLAPILQARSDTFVIRAYGEIGAAGGPAARVWCEAVVQRTARYVDDRDAAWENPLDDALHALNLRFGRQFEIVSFRWLDASEVGEGGL